MLAYEVIDKNGERWACYMYKAMAERVAERNNEDITLDKLSPFDVREVYED